MCHSYLTFIVFSGLVLVTDEGRTAHVFWCLGKLPHQCSFNTVVNLDLPGGPAVGVLPVSHLTGYVPSHSVMSDSLWPQGLDGACQAPLSMEFSRQEFWGHGFNPWSGKILWQLSPCTTTAEAQGLQNPCSTTVEATAMRSLCSATRE